MKRFALLFAVILGPTTAHAAEPVCNPNPSESLKRAVIGIEREFSPEEVYINEHYQRITGVEGTAWFVDSKTIATIGHVVTGAKLNGQWKDVTLRWSTNKDEGWSNSLKARVRLKDMVVGDAALEPIMTLELEQGVPEAQKAKIAGRPLQRNEMVVGIGYKDQTLRFVTGRLAYPEPSRNDDNSSDKPPQPYLPFELVDLEKKEGVGDRYAFDHGSSGSPIFNCDGEVVAVVQGFKTRDMSLLGRTEKITTPWGQANIAGVSALPLLDKKK